MVKRRQLRSALRLSRCQRRVVLRRCGRLDMFVPRLETQQISVRVASHRCVVTPPLLRQLRPEDE